MNLDHEWYWDSFQRRLVDNSDNLREQESERTEDVIAGHRWQLTNGEFIGCDQGLKNLAGTVSREWRRFSTGAEATLYIPKDPCFWLVSLHGGPESYEGGEIRYGGLYRDLLRSGIGIVVLNYSGSVRPDGDRLGENIAWGRWNESVCADFSELLRSGEETFLQTERISLLGASFGGALALLLQKKFAIGRAILSSPLLDLGAQRSRAGLNYADWFAARFSEQDYQDMNIENLTAPGSGEVHMLYGERDEVLGAEIFKSICNPSWSITSRPGGHMPRTYREHLQQRRFYQGIFNKPGRNGQRHLFK